MMAEATREEADAFGFGAIGKDVTLDLQAFEPKAKPIDRASAEAAAEIAQREHFTRRRSPDLDRELPGPKADAPAPRTGKSRIKIQDLLGIEDRYPETQRAQLNLLAPVPIVLRWRKLIAAANGKPAWEVLEQAMDALESAQSDLSLQNPS